MRSRSPDGSRSQTQRGRGLGAHHGHLRAATRAAAAHREVPGLRVVEPALPSRAARPGRRGDSPAHATAGGMGCWSRSAPTSTTSGTAPTSRSRATPTFSRRCGSGSSTCCRPVRAPNAARSHQGTDRAGLRRPRLLGHRGFRASRPHVHQAAGRRRRAAVAGVDTRPCQGARGPARPRGRGLSLANHPRPGVLGLLAGRHRGLARQRRHCDGVRAVPHGHGRRLVGEPTAAWRSSSRPRGCGSRSGTTTATASGTSTGSPGQTSTQRWSATTCSPT